MTLEFLSTLHVEVIQGPWCQEGYISFYFQGQLYELHLAIFNEIFGFPPSMDLIDRQVPNIFNRNQFLGAISRTYGYNTSSCKGTAIRNPYIQVAQ